MRRVLLGVAMTAASAWTQTAVSPRFEVASVKTGADVFSTRPERSPGRIRWTTQLAYLVGYAYALDFSRISGAPLGAIYTIEATYDPAATEAEVRLMLQSLLSERFQMRCHRVAKETEGYALSVAKGGLRIREAKAEEGADGHVAASLQSAGVIAVRGQRATIADLAANLARSTSIPVWDLTGLTGKYDFTFRYAQDLGAESRSDAPALATALQENLGLQLKKQKGTVESLVVDHIEAPSGN